MSVIISVIMPVYNVAPYVKVAVKSILNQTFADFELIIIDDASTDGTCELIQQFTDARIKLIRKPKNSGYTDSLNYGLSIAKGAYVARMDGDDISLPTRFEKQVNLLNKDKETVLCGTWFEVIHNKFVVSHPVDFEEIKIALIKDTALAHPTVMFRSSFLKENNIMYDPSFEPAEDYELWTRIAGLGKIVNIPEVLLQYRQHYNQVSNTRSNLQQKYSYLCRSKMLFHLLDSISVLDERMAYFFFHPNEVITTSDFDTIISWFDLLTNLNQNKRFFNLKEFESIILEKKEIIVHTFYKHRVNYTPNLIIHYLSTDKKLRKGISIKDEFILFIKCSLFWRVRT